MSSAITFEGESVSEVGVAVEADLADGGDDLGEVDGAFAEVTLILEVDLADPILAQPANFLQDVVIVLGVVAYVVLDL